jgi:hypothetical protein
MVIERLATVRNQVHEHFELDLDLQRFLPPVETSTALLEDELKAELESNND